jgi:LmbE family N-acetylglucosaminyl deacetylase
MPFRISAVLILLQLALLLPTFAQRPEQLSSSQIFNAVRKLQVLGNVLYLAAHPDDENTRFIAWCANERLMNTHYLSLTRGDGGQNLIGPELREELGLIRTQELLAARRIDGGTQSFTRANDFGFSKTAEETLTIWDRQQVLADVVWTIRKMRPDVIVCRFPPDSRGGHGHHTASALLGIESFSLAADPKAFPEQLKHVEPWQAKRIVTNTGRWWNAEVSANDRGVVTHDMGTYSAILGTSITEIAALSRSCHRSQGFGSTGTRGEQMEFFEHLKGDTARSTLFDGIDMSWERMTDAGRITELCTELEAEFDLSAPHRSIPNLLTLRQELQKLKDGFWRTAKLKEVDQLIRHCAGLFLEATSDTYALTIGDSIRLKLEAVNRSPVQIQLRSVNIPELNIKDEDGRPLPFNSRVELKYAGTIPAKTPVSHPFWLRDLGSEGMYRVDDILMTHLPENRSAFVLNATVEVEGQSLTFTILVDHKWNDPVTGEKHRPLVITPPLTLSFSKNLEVFTTLEPRTVEVTVRASSANLSGELRVMPPKGWTLSDAVQQLRFSRKGEEQRVKLVLTPQQGAVNGKLSARFIVDGQEHDLDQRTLTYDHIPTQVHFPKAECRTVLIDLKRKGDRIGYVAGAGDGVADGLRAMGYRVDELAESDLTPEKLDAYDAIVTGIRFLNVNERAAFMMPALMRYAEAGGTLLVQYNTSRALETGTMVPYPLKLSRDRVTEEHAPVTFILPEHPALSHPNVLGSSDFTGWAQERGLYFPNEWDARYAAPLRMNDTGEQPKDGSLLIAQIGKGHFIYTGISFFRQLPEGVPGAYRLLANLLSLGI